MSGPPSDTVRFCVVFAVSDAVIKTINSLLVYDCHESKPLWII